VTATEQPPASTAAERYAAKVAAADAQAARLAAGRPLLPDTWGGGTAARFTADPRRPLDPAQERLAGFLAPEDVLLDIGGGAGRMSLPLAGRCREVVNVEPSRGMGEAFGASAADAHIQNARWVQASWPDTDVTGDVALACHVTYFVRDITAFVERLCTAVRRRVFILVNDQPPLADSEQLYPLLFGEPVALRPTYQELLPVLWAARVLPDIHVLPSSVARPPLPQDRETAIDIALRRLEPFVGASLTGDGRLRRVVEQRFDAFFQWTDAGFQPRSRPGGASLLITWENDPAASRLL
jgi:hypothetical protein